MEPAGRYSGREGIVLINKTKEISILYYNSCTAQKNQKMHI
jgi:hypothetical protein